MAAVISPESEIGVDSPSPSSRAAQHLAHDRFHRRFALPATADHGELQVSYADVGCTPEHPGHASQECPTILFIPGMFASRYLSVSMHTIAEKLGVRVLMVDRPGMGHSTDVPLHQRLDVWIELVPRLLEHLQIQHVALAAHSAGTIYLLHTLVRCRDVLDPNKPLVALVAPWVDPAHSQVVTMQIVQNLPTSVFSIWHHIPKFVSAGGTAFSKLTQMLPSSSGMLSSGETPPLERNRQRIERDYGLPVAMQKELQTLTQKAMCGENMAGADSEALLCLRKGPAGLWGECEDYPRCVHRLAELERSRRRATQGAAAGDSGGGEKLRINAYFAQSDSMIGSRGQRYFEDCWKGSSGVGDEFQDALTFRAVTINETDHDSVVQSVEVLTQIFLSAGGAAPSVL
ncbi:hypothetical protein VSDG_07509 [Cytospora chrysosperma]|uniref:AB hydrolase-1 domain-containing protein n=1 Tax=Cytospora chrysosperma TaxID=252740 RepID=A0A423VM83_CYTCH|nr:hypothetical protein VSDG_07509 [Valsa sordida]